MKQIFKAFLYSLNGLKILFCERAFVQELLLIPIVLLVVTLVDLLSYRLYILFSYVLVLLAEVFNTCIEKTVNRISTEIHPLSKEIKDISSAAVFIAISHLLISFVLGLLY